MRLLIFWVFFLFIISTVNSQSTYYPRKHQVVRWLDRSQIKNPNSSNIHLAFQKIRKSSVAFFIDSVGNYNNKSIFQKEFLTNDNPFYFDPEISKNSRPNIPLIQYFYQNPSSFLYLDKPSFKVKANPIIDFNAGKETANNLPVFQNTRGFEVEILVDNKIYFYSSLFENQRRFFSHIDKEIRRNETIPGQGFYKKYKSSLSNEISGFDYLNAVAYFGLPISKNIHLELGHGNQFIGHGYHSLLLNDYSHNYFYLTLNTNIWKFHYQNIFAELASISSKYNVGSLQIPKKYMAAHYLSYKPTKNIEVGFFETVVFSREDHFEFQYLNPIILYRTVEQFLDSPDNVLIGLNARWDLFKSISLYSQCIIDEFKIKEITSNDQWWGNKYGFQAGLQYIDVAKIDQLDLRVEYNMVRPYTYSHFIPLEEFQEITTSNYTHHGQTLAHPLGANFQELLFQLKYQFTSKLYGELLYSNAIRGVNTNTVNFGSNPLSNNTTRPSDYGISFLQGNKENVHHINVDLHYQIFHNAFIDFQYVYHTIKSDTKDLKTNYFGGGIRLNISKHHVDY